MLFHHTHVTACDRWSAANRSISQLSRSSHSEPKLSLWCKVRSAIFILVVCAAFLTHGIAAKPYDQPYDGCTTSCDAEIYSNSDVFYELRNVDAYGCGECVPIQPNSQDTPVEECIKTCDTVGDAVYYELVNVDVRGCGECVAIPAPQPKEDTPENTHEQLDVEDPIDDTSVPLLDEPVDIEEQQPEDPSIGDKNVEETNIEEDDGSVEEYVGSSGSSSGYDYTANIPTYAGIAVGAILLGTGLGAVYKLKHRRSRVPKRFNRALSEKLREEEVDLETAGGDPSMSLKQATEKDVLELSCQGSDRGAHTARRRRSVRVDTPAVFTPPCPPPWTTPAPPPTVEPVDALTDTPYDIAVYQMADIEEKIAAPTMGATEELRLTRLECASPSTASPALAEEERLRRQSQLMTLCSTSSAHF